ncbi:Mevalonate kinase [Coemansia sp. Benny D115]|nr:Mevalonate kinase [Coemansia sp. Benny D115]
MVVAITSSFSALSQTPFVTSAPGKAILFGEHAVVYGKTALAGSLAMRAYALVYPRTDSKITFILPDVQVNLSYTPDQIPTLATVQALEHPGDIVHQLDANLLPQEGPGRTAAMTFLYLCGQLLSKQKRESGFSIAVRSLVPVGSGLGSSAAFNVALAAALLKMEGMVSKEHADNGVLDTADYELINQWAFRGEQVAHGTPSGIDNSVATWGGFLRYIKGTPPQPLQNSSSIKMLISDTQVPKSTKGLVAGVRQLRDSHTIAIDYIMDAINQISKDTAARLQDPKLPAGDLQKHLSEAVALNHGLLAALGVSHQSLERVRQITATYGMPSKLTGAGGGGCAITLVSDNQENVEAMTGELLAEGFHCYPTVVGGPGVAITGSVGTESVENWIKRVSKSGSLKHTPETLVEAFCSLSNSTFDDLAPQ